MSSILKIADANIEFSQTAQYINNEASIIGLAIDAGRWDDAEMLLKALLKYVRGQQIRIDECYPHFARAYARQQLAAVERRLQVGLREVILHRPSEQPEPMPTEIVSEEIPVDLDTPRWVPIVAWGIILLAIYAVGYLSIQITGAVT